MARNTPRATAMAQPAARCTERCAAMRRMVLTIPASCLYVPPRCTKVGVTVAGVSAPATHRPAGARRLSPSGRDVLRPGSRGHRAFVPYSSPALSKLILPRPSREEADEKHADECDARYRRGDVQSDAEEDQRAYDHT